MTRKEIEQIRQKIDDVDRRLLEALNERAQLVLDLAQFKIAEGLKLFDPEREAYILKTVTENNPGPLSIRAVTHLFERIIDESRSLERTEVYDKPKE